jgi:enterochelin esterase-like enzyme
MMSGQPGSPQNVFEAGRLDKVFDTFASSHGGLAPIVVVPDQLGSPHINPMCSDAWAGNAETYLTVDVPRWIRAHLNVASASSSWAVAGWSQGGTCAIQLGAGHPEIFGNIIDISGESVPSLGSVDLTVSRGFAGNTTNYEAHQPAEIIAAHEPYNSEIAVFGWGEGDSRFGPGLADMAARARAAIMTVTTVVSPGTAHDWTTVRFVMTHGIDPVFVHFGIVNPVG